MAGRLEGRTALVTGGAGGCGLAASRLFAREGARVGIVDLPSSNGAVVAKELRADGFDAVFAPADVSRPDEVTAAVDVVENEFGNITALMNHAGILAAGPFLDTSAANALGDRVIHTVGRGEDLAALAATGSRPRVVLEALTSMRRHGFAPGALRTCAAAAGVRHEGFALHLPLPGPASVAEAEALLGAAVDGVVWVSHLAANDVARLAAAHPGLRIRPRIGTELWLGDRGALSVRARVLDAHPIRRGERYGYRQRRAARSGTLLVVSGGTAHSIGLEAPTGQSGARARTSAAARGGLDALGLTRSPFVIDGKQPLFAEPPHMQASMLFLPESARVPGVGSEIEARVRYTATGFDRVEIS